MFYLLTTQFIDPMTADNKYLCCENKLNRVTTCIFNRANKQIEKYCNKQITKSEINHELILYNIYH